MKGRKTISILLLFFLCFNICSYVFVRAYYEGCKEYITENYCINKDKPALHCNGQCHINKIISNTENSTDTLAISDTLLHIYLPSAFHMSEIIENTRVHIITQHSFSYIIFYNSAVNTVDTPPPLS